MFDDKKIAETTDYRNHLNKYNVIYLDITAFTSDAQMQNRSLRDVPGMIQEALLKNLAECGFQIKEGDGLNDNLIRVADQLEGKKFVFIIDEWNAMIREAKDDLAAQKIFLSFLRGWFKNGQFTPKVVAAAYMTEILPIKKDGTQSAISEFDEYSMIKPVIKLAYYTYRDHFVQFEELPGGEGFADVAYLPRHDSDWPALIIELKWNKSAGGAIDQILNKKYANAVENFGTDILLVGIHYDKDAPSGRRGHTCSIVRYKADVLLRVDGSVSLAKQGMV